MMRGDLVVLISQLWWPAWCLKCESMGGVAPRSFHRTLVGCCAREGCHQPVSGECGLADESVGSASVGLGRLLSSIVCCVRTFVLARLCPLLVGGLSVQGS